MLIYPPTQLVNLSTTSYLVNRHDRLFPKEEAARNRVRLLRGEALANDARRYAAFYSSNTATAATRSRLAPLFEFDTSTSTSSGHEHKNKYERVTATEDEAADEQMSGEKNDVDSIVRADERERTSRIRETELSEHHPTGDPALEKQYLAELLNPEYSSLLADSFEVSS